MIVLETGRLLFRDHEAADLDAFCAMEADPEVRRYVGGTPRTREAAEAKFRSTYLPPIRGRMGMWATVYKPEACYIGYCGVYPHFGSQGAIAGEGTLGYYLARPYWGRGLATEAARAFVTFAFDELRLTRIVTAIDARHEVSRHILERKLGFRIVRHEGGERRSFDHFELLPPQVS
jgi:RimJ/RimL family protein N-acetyltransferase